MPFTTLPSATVHYSDLTTASNGGHSVTPTPAAPTGATLVFIHGLGSSQNFYLPLLPHLPAATRCILLDTPGAARSPLPATAPTVSSLASTVWELLDHLSITSPVTVVGHSMGCLVALHAAQQRPTAVERLVLFGPVYPSPALAGVFAARIGTVREKGMESMANVIPAAATGAGCGALERALIRELLMGQEVEGYAALCNAIATSTVGELEKVQACVLVVAGSEDKSAPLEGCQRLVGELGANTELRILEGCGHWHVVEMAAQCGQAVHEFLQ
ncbi:Alpha/Beta hydrolase protein [Geopyxis carbonaria]|nr:Alpha/Beta hydrolase protein [Geopyxis carbonaria]